MLPWAFLSNQNPDIDFTDEAVIHCDVPVVKIFFLGHGNL